MIPYYECDGPGCAEQLFKTIHDIHSVPPPWWVLRKGDAEWHFHHPSCVERFFEEDVVW